MKKYIKTIRDINVTNKIVFVRVDFNVPFDDKGNVSDKTRIIATLPTIKYLLQKNAKIILATHLGRPKGVFNAKYSLKPIVEILKKYISSSINYIPKHFGPIVEEAISKMSYKSVLLLENLRFHKGEESNDIYFSRSLANLADIYVNDAFGASHRRHASIENIVKYVPVSVFGLLMEKEINFLGSKTKNPKRPFVVVLGGAKVSEKIKVIKTLLLKTDVMIIGGAMAYTFALAQGKNIGDSLKEKDKIVLAKEILNEAKLKNVKMILPEDHRIIRNIDLENRNFNDTQIAIDGKIPKGWKGIDIGPKTIEIFQSILIKCQSKINSIKYANEETFCD